MANTGNTGNTQQERAYEFTASLDAWKDKLDGRLNEAYRNVCLLLFMNIIVGGNYSPGTPVDTGFARNSWVVGIGAPGEPRQPAENAERATVSLTSDAEAQTAVLDATIDDEVHLTSNCVYMTALEDGHSDQAPTGMVWLAIHAGPQIAADVVKEMLS
jgi:hypothetical protein